MDVKELEFAAGHATGYLEMADMIVGVIAKNEGQPAEKVLALIKGFCMKELKDSQFPYKSRYGEEEGG